jgi:hypothetical protein
MIELFMQEASFQTEGYMRFEKYSPIQIEESMGFENYSLLQIVVGATFS